MESNTDIERALATATSSLPTLSRLETRAEPGAFRASSLLLDISPSLSFGPPSLTAAHCLRTRSFRVLILASFLAFSSHCRACNCLTRSAFCWSSEMFLAAMSFDSFRVRSASKLAWRCTPRASSLAEGLAKSTSLMTFQSSGSISTHESSASLSSSSSRASMSWKRTFTADKAMRTTPSAKVFSGAPPPSKWLSHAFRTQKHLETLNSLTKSSMTWLDRKWKVRGQNVAESTSTQKLVYPMFLARPDFVHSSQSLS
mmetsp:Transcript_39635/g.127043  ORF Transcript_39635/g.127043 Transcript_39635/m.127043 type:complete len:257 (+) Transcript_39635:1155-1925(+)